MTNDDREQLRPPPEYIDQRIRLFERLRAEHDAFVRGVCVFSVVCGVVDVWRFVAQPRDPITITLPDGSERQGTRWETSPLDVAKEISKSRSERAVIAKVNVTHA
jgi:threonyl-tRNA synthetase